MLKRDPKNIFCYHREIENYTYQVLDFLLFDKHEYTQGIFRSVILVSTFMLWVYVTFFFVHQDLIDRINSYFQRIAFQMNLLVIGFQHSKSQFFSSELQATFTGMALRILVRRNDAKSRRCHNV